MWTVEYPNIPSAISPIPHGDCLPVPNPSKYYHPLSDDDEDKSRNVVSEPLTSQDPDLDPQNDSSEQHRLTHGELNDLVRELSLPTDKADLLAYRLKQWT